MQAKTVILTANEPFLVNENTSSEVIHIEVDLDTYPLEKLVDLSNSLTHHIIAEIRLSRSHVLLKEDQEQIARFICHLDHVKLVVFSDATFEIESAQPASLTELSQLAKQVTARNRFLSQFNALGCINPTRVIVDKWFNLNHNPRQKLYYLIPGMNSGDQPHNASIIEMGDYFFQHLLANFPAHTNQWVVNLKLNKAQLNALNNYAEQAVELPFERLALYVDSDLITDPEFQPLLQALSVKSLRGLTLIFPEKELENESAEQVAILLAKTVLPNANFPVKIALQTTQLGEQSYRGDAFRSFESELIQRMQQVNSPVYTPPAMVHKPMPFFTFPQANGSTKKLALKALLGKGKVSPKEIRQQFQHTYIRTEVQHVAVQQQQQQAVAQTVVSQTQAVHQIKSRLQQAQQTIAGIYDGKLVDFSEFSGEHYRNIALVAGYAPKQIEYLYQVIQQEFFANLPHAIKYVSEEAARELAENLPHFCALNSDNLPEGSHFVLKQTVKGEIVLDVNRYISQKKVNPFTPKVYKLPAQQPLMYPIDLPEETVKTWIDHDGLFRLICYSQEGYDTKKLQNIWAKFGEPGVVKLFSALNALDKQTPGLAKFLVNSYLNYFPDWELFLLPKTDFFTNLERLKKYDETQLTCLKKFMVNSGCSQHHLTDTLNAFDAFWENVSELCQTHSVNMADINRGWMTATGYVPIFLATPEQVKQLKPGEFAITKEKWSNEYSGERILTCYVKNEQGQIIEFDIPQEELNKAWIKKNPCIFIRADEKPDENTLSKLPCSAYINVGNIIYYFDYKNRHLLHVYGEEGLHYIRETIDRIQRLTHSCQYQMKGILGLINRGQPIELNQALTTKQLSQISHQIYHYHHPIYRRLFDIRKKDLEADELEPIWLDVLAIANEKNHVQLNSGNPVVYMERLWGILNKARDIAEQLIALEGLTLDHYSAPYASQFESFNVVSAGMGLCYRPDQQNAQLFSDSMQGYAIGFEEIFATVFDSDDDNFDPIHNYNKNFALFLAHLCRLIGQTKQSISINRYQSELRNYVNQDLILRYLEAKNLTLGLFFLMHERYEEKISLKDLLFHVKATNNHEVIDYVAKKLKQFFALNIYLNDVESVPFLQRIGAMNSAEFEGTYGSSIKESYIEKLFNHLEKNKYGVFKLLQKLRGKQTFIHALDIVHYWDEHYPVLGLHYREDLLLFSVLMWDVSYLQTMKNKDKQTKALEKINSIANFLILAAKNPYPNNYHYAFKLIVQSNQYFTAEAFIAAFKEIETLQKFEPETVNTILEKHKFQLSIAPLWVNEPCNLKDTLIDLIFNLNHFIATGDFLFNAPDSVSEKDFKKITKQEKNIDTKLKFLNSRYQLLSQKALNFPEDDYHYQYYEGVFLTLDELETPTLEMLNAYQAIDFPIIFTEKAWRKNQSDTVWLAYIDEQGNKQLKCLEGAFNAKNYLTEIRTSALYFKKTADEEQKNVLGNQIIDLNFSKIELFSNRQILEEKAKIYQDWQTECTHLRKLSIKELNQKFFDLWNTQGLVKKLIASPFLYLILKSIKQIFIRGELSEIGDSEFAKHLQTKLLNLSDFNEVDDFDKLQRAIKQAKTLASIFKKWLTTESFITYQKDFIPLFNPIDCQKWNYDALLNTLNLLVELNPRDYRNVLKQLLKWQDDYHKNASEYLIRLDKIKWLSDEKVSIDIISRWMPFISGNIEAKSLDGILKWVIHAGKSNDSLLNFVSNNLNLSIESIEKLIALTQALSLKEKMAISGLFEAILSENQKNVNSITTFLDHLGGDEPSNLLKLMAHCQAIPGRKKQGIDYTILAQQLSRLSPQDFVQVEIFCRNSSLNIQGLSVLALQLNNHSTIQESIAAYEKAPFGPRDFEAQFDTSPLARIVNGVTDLQNQSYRTYQERKQLMEEILYVNALGKNLPAYRGKPAKDLSDQEIQQLFSQLKNNEFTFPNRFAKQLYALGLLREAFYRKTGEFAYCSQLAAVIDAMQKPADQNVLQQIDTGQGKTLSDTLKAVLLWLDNEGGEVITSSRADATRDHGLFLGTLRFLGIPVADGAITQTSDFSEFQSEGINYSTVSDLSLFYQRAKVCGIKCRQNNAQTFMILSEADRATLDDHTLFRYAEFDPDGIGSENEWLYYGINDFVRSTEFKQDKTSEQEDIVQLREFLTQYAIQQSKDLTIIPHLTDEQLLTWIKSAIVVKRLLYKDIHYVTRPRQQLINGELQPVFEIKIIQETDNRVDEEAVYDKTIQPLLCAYLNSKLKPNDPGRFMIESSTKTILVSNSKNLIQQYAKTGVIWGSTATVGSLAEVTEQAQTYGFICSAIPPYQPNRVDKNPAPIVTLGKGIQNLTIWAEIQKSQAKGQNTVVVAWHDIPKAKAFYEWLKIQGYREPQLQHYTDQDTENELVIIQNAPNKITSATRGLGRNTNIPYDRKQGMLVIQTEPDTLRNTGQLAGRTGREGSEGTFLRIFNQEDFPGETVEQAVQRLEATSQQRRESESLLFDCFGYLLDHVDNYFKDNKEKAKFLKTVWASFSETVEANYRRISAEAIDQKEKFIAEAVEQFNVTVNRHNYSGLQIPNDSLNLDNLINAYPLTPHYQIYKKTVELSDCIPAPIIAYHALPTVEKALVDDEVTINAEKIKNTVKQLLEKANPSFHDTRENIFQTYLLPLMSDTRSLQAIRQIAQQELAEFFNKKLKENAGLSWFERMILGVKSHLEQITDDQHYLVLFSALTASSSVENQEAINLNLAKNIATALLTNYLTNAWFISAEKVNATQTLINSLENAENIADLITLLSTNKTEILQQDIKTNQSQTAFWQASVNKTGSRLQNHLDKILLSFTALQSHHPDEQILTDLLTQLWAVVITSQQGQLTALIDKKDFDSIKSVLPTLTFTDQSNAKVILNSLDKWLNHQLHFCSLVGKSFRQ